MKSPLYQTDIPVALKRRLEKAEQKLAYARCNSSYLVIKRYERQLNAIQSQIANRIKVSKEYYNSNSSKKQDWKSKLIEGGAILNVSSN